MSHVTACRTALIVPLALAVALLFVAMLPEIVTGQPSDEGEQSSDVNDIDLQVTMEQSTPHALPGDQVEYTAIIENNTGEPQTNLEAIMAVTQQADAMTYVKDSTFIRYGEGSPEVPLSPLSGRPTLLAETIEPNQTIQVRWSFEVGRCVSRNDWARVALWIQTDNLEPPVAYTDLYIWPHTDIWATRHGSVGYEVDTPTPAPGEAVRHIVRVVNDSDVILYDVTVHLWHDESRARVLPTVSENGTFTILSDRDGRPGPVVPIDPKWSEPLGRFTLNYLNPGKVLVLSWTDYVAEDAPIGAVATPRIGVRWASSTEWTNRTTRITVAPPRGDLSVKIRQDDMGGYLSSARFPGGLVNMRVTISNDTDVPRQGVSVSLDLPTALSYVSGSGTYSTAAYVAGNSRRLPDDWINDGAQLLTIAPGEDVTIAFKTRIGDDISPQDGIDVYAVLKSPTDEESRAHMRIDVANEPALDLNVRDLRPAQAGSAVWFSVTVQNSGQVPLTDVKFGFEQPCPSMANMTYIPGTLRIESQTLVLRDDTSVLSQQEQGEDVSIELGDLDPDEKIRIAMRFRLADDLEPGTVAGPHLIASGRSTDRRLVPYAGAGTPTEITVAQPAFVTEETFEARVEEILDDIQANTKAIRANVSADEFETQVQDILGDIQANTKAIDEATTAIGDQAEEINNTTKKTLDTVVENLDPWDQSLSWILRLGGFAALASLIAGIVFPFLLVGVWKRARRRKRRQRRRATSPDFLGPPLPSKRARSTLWATDRYRAGAAQLAAARRHVRDWIDGLWRR